MGKIQVLNVEKKLKDAGVLVDGVALDRPGKPGISVDFNVDATPEQKALAAQIVAAYDQAAEDAAQATVEAAKQADLDLVRKAQAGLTQLQTDLAGIDAMNAAQVRDVVKHLLTVEIGVVKALMRVL